MKKHNVLTFLCLFVGIIFSYWMTYLPWKTFIAAQSWKEVDCEIKDIFSPYSRNDINLRYHYEYKGKQYRGDKISLVPNGLENLINYQEITKKYALNSAHTCYVNPDNPREVVLDRQLKLLMICTLLPFIYLLFSIVLLLENKVSAVLIPSIKEGYFEFPQDISSVKRILLGLIVIIMTGLVTLMLYYDYWLPRSGLKLSIIPTFILALCVLIVIFLVVSVIVDVLKYFNPRIDLKVNSDVFHPGKEYLLEYQFEKETNQIKALSFTLVCVQILEQTKEQAYAENILYNDTFFRRKAPLVTRQHEIRFTIPANANPTLEIGNSQITWIIKCKYKRYFLPVMEKEYRIRVS